MSATNGMADPGKGCMAPPVAGSTIFALSSGTGRAGIAVIRMSGPATRAALEALAVRVPVPRLASLRTLRHPRTGEPFDEGLVLFFPGPQSFTGEDMAELQVHGSRAVVKAVIAALGSLPGLQLAEPGAFTRRALENGRLDLTQVEGLADLIDSDTERQRAQALDQMKGRLSGAVETWRATLLSILADLEAELDFADEGDVNELACRARARQGLAELQDALARALAGARHGERVRDGVTVVIAGPPNAGKSTLLNALAGRDVAIVSEQPGTTRDVLEVHLDLDGYPLVLADTAGLRETVDPVEQLGVGRTRDRVATADAVLWLSPADAPEPPPDPWRHRCLVVASKIDSHAERPHETAELSLSAKTGEGLPGLLDRLRQIAEDKAGAEPALITRERQRLAAEGSLAFVVSAGAALESGLPLELVTEDVRLAARSLAVIIGLVDVEDVLDQLFQQFCIGK